MRKTALMLLTVITVVKAHTQENGTSHSISGGITGQRIKDASIYSRSLNGNGTRIQYDFLKQTSRRRTALTLAWDKTTFNFTTNRAILNNFSVKLSDGFQILNSNNRRFKAYVGYAIDINPSFTKVMGKTTDYYSWNSINTLNLYQSYSYSWKRNSIVLDIYLPVAGFVSRPQADAAYPSDMNGVLYNSYTTPSFTSWHNYKAVSFSLRYNRIINKRMKFFIGVDYNYQDQQLVLPVQRQAFGIKAGISFRL